MQNIIKIISLLLINICLLGCLKPVPAPNITYYRLEGTSHYTSSKHTFETLLIAMPTAAPGYQTADIIYSLYPYQLAAYTKHRWVAPPAQMLQSLIAQSMQNTDHFAAVVTTPMVVKANYSLNVQLIKLQQDFHNENSEVAITLRAVLLGGQNNVVMGKLYQAKQYVSEKTPYGGVRAANLAVEMVLTKLSKDVVLHAR